MAGLTGQGRAGPFGTDKAAESPGSEKGGHEPGSYLRKWWPEQI